MRTWFVFLCVFLGPVSLAASSEQVSHAITIHVPQEVSLDNPLEHFERVWDPPQSGEGSEQPPVYSVTAV